MSHKLRSMRNVGFSLVFSAASLFAFVGVQPAQAMVLDLGHPSSPIVSESGPFGYGGRGVIFRAEQNFIMNSLAMRGDWSGSLDLGVDVYSVGTPGSRSLLSSSTFADQVWSGSTFTELNHTHSFMAGSIYEVMFRFEDPGLRIAHYDFNNPSNVIANGYDVDGVLRVLDGSDFDTAQNQNTWLPHFKIGTGSITPVPLPAAFPLLAGGLGLFGFMGWRRKRKVAVAA